jgi:hypothetical protein
MLELIMAAGVIALVLGWMYQPKRWAQAAREIKQFMAERGASAITVVEVYRLDPHTNARHFDVSYCDAAGARWQTRCVVYEAPFSHGGEREWEAPVRVG